ncbi:MAG: aminotransferase class IV [Deltaproteobacteria bacterium]|nr:aminotransferase class IV [Deltaproteobacteria bacterium]
MGYLAYINGQIVPAKEAKISVFDAAYLYGEGLFEVLLAHRGKVLFFDRHLHRLFRGTRLLGIKSPLSRDRLKKAVYRTLKANHLNEAFIRIGLSTVETDVGVRKRSRGGTNLVIFVKSFVPYPSILYRRGARLILVTSSRNDPRSISGIKSTNFLSKIMGRREIQRRRADEGVLLNAEGRVTECAGSNIFIVLKGKLLTPPLEEGLLPGVTREVLLELAKKLKIPVQQKSLMIKNLKQAEEIFITSTLKKILPVHKFEGCRKKVPGTITTLLARSFQEYVERQV